MMGGSLLVEQSAALSANAALAAARAQLHEALRANDDHRREQYAHAARDSAAEVLLNPTISRSERDFAGDYFRDADRIVGGCRGIA